MQPTKCQAAKNVAVAKYLFCRQKAAASLILLPAEVAAHEFAVGRCKSKLMKKWTKLEQASAGGCPTLRDGTIFEAFLAEHSARIVKVLSAVGTLGDAPLRSGQEHCFDNAGAPLACAGSGQDGELRSGAARQYADNGDGTVTDTATGLMWEKQSLDATIHDVAGVYTWAQVHTMKLASLNTDPCFAGHCDWRLPNVNELSTLIDYGRMQPAVDPAFNTGCRFGCIGVTCSCTGFSLIAADATHYWTSTQHENVTSAFYRVDFAAGAIDFDLKTKLGAVRAVRGGS